MSCSHHLCQAHVSHRDYSCDRWSKLPLFLYDRGGSLFPMTRDLYTHYRIPLMEKCGKSIPNTRSWGRPWHIWAVTSWPWLCMYIGDEILHSYMIGLFHMPWNKDPYGKINDSMVHVSQGFWTLLTCYWLWKPKVKMQDTEHIQLIFQLSHIIHVSKVYLPTFDLFFDGSSCTLRDQLT